jgi:putative phosphoesterase
LPAPGVTTDADEHNFPVVLIGILSDTHGHGEAASAAVSLLRTEGAHYLIHCGDVGSPSVLDALADAVPAAFVWGNTDFDRAALSRYAKALKISCFDTFGELDLAGKRIAVTHGDDARLVRRILAEQQHDYLLVGHTHVKENRHVGRVRVINPGALYRAAEKTVALLDAAADELRFLTVRW